MIVLGDFNINLLPNSTDYKRRHFDDFVQTVDLKQYVTDPTHFTSSSETLIDVVCSDLDIKSLNVDYIPTLGHHAFITVGLNVKKPKPLPQWITYRPLKNIILEQFNFDLNSINWEHIKSFTDVNKMVATFTDYMIKLFDLHAPERTVRVKGADYPWITDNVKYMMSLRDAAHKRFRITNSASDNNYYKDLKHLVNAALHNEKRAYFQSNINNNIKNSAKLWQNLKNTVLRKHKNDCLPDSFSDPDIINKHFLDIPGNNNINLSDIIYYESHRHGTYKFNITPIDELMVGKIINKLKSNALGCDGISLAMIMLTLPRTLDIITFIINYSIQTSTFPDPWKIALVSPIPKVPTPSQYKDLRPISLLSCMSKILEKAVYNQMSHYLEVNGILPDVQSGFRRGRSTSTALIDVVDNILASADKGMSTILTLLDFSRAFDTINVPLLIAKLTYYGFDANTVKWFYSYLDQRSQIVKLRKCDGNTVASAEYPVSRGVPQGSTLGPLLFILYASDITNEIVNCKYHIYADDLQLYLSGPPSDVNNTCDLINHDLDRISTWSNKNFLKLNPDKSKYIVIGTRKQVQTTNNNNPNIKIAGVDIEQVTEARNLGLTFDNYLRFEKHVTEMVKNCFFRLKTLYKIRRYIDVNLRIQLCESLVLSKLNYADTVYGPCLLRKTDKLLQRVQNACIRFCMDIPPRSHVTPYLNSCGLLKVAARQRLHLAALLFGVIKYKSPQYLFNKLAWSRDYHSINTRASTYLMVTPKHKTALFRHSFRYAASFIWNTLRPPLRDLKSITTFKYRYRMILLEEQRKGPYEVIPTS
ncbi:hypothetical protein JYU34_009925 [Plutella xylostella]|uniref:Reverse transcriptase domain-containing protein n=1 Tax=Plutella xylostella TaxID=51655 RepID=A0ABQ7QKR8_PLUXY|nr:hypothetical protein JYU34_009925 [Plutella xylostella]